MIRITLPETVKPSAAIGGAQVILGSFPIEVWAKDAAVISVVQGGNRIDYLAQPDGTAYQITNGVCRVWLAKAGEALYGQRWQSELARALNVSDRTIRRWVNPSGANPAPGNIRAEVIKLLEDRIGLINGLVSQAAEAIAV